MLSRRSLDQSFFFALRGLVYAFRSERNMRFHLGGALLALALAVILSFSMTEWIILTMIIFLVFITETVNTAIEINVDLVTKKQRPRAMMAKDVAAGAVLLSTLNAIIVGVILFGKRIIEDWLVM